ncbi:hypothetical protein [Catalinimonas niigatensis]|uniref:hypothetical protein n=1 Tax=Catalinimonas niigatensis TaxID=1397264 RepID=UPI002666F5F8|nr:hypothetical protein [Catalinimonas niigatensis]WPP51504.1 hypothetical protein PZB72_03760 [Catalinimonas niigatensis]
MKKLVLFIGIAIFLGMNELMAQCSMCRTTIENNVSAGDTALGSGLNLGILYLFFTPYIVFGVLAFFWYKKSKENAKKISAFRYHKS